MGGVLIAGVAALCACSGSSNTPSSSPTTARGTKSVGVDGARRPGRAPTTTTSTPEFSFDDSVPPPKLVNTGTNYVAILKSLEAYGNWLAAHRPDPSFASEILSRAARRNSGCSLATSRDFAQYNIRAIERLGEPTVHTIVSTTPDAFSAKVVENIRVHKTVDSSGPSHERGELQDADDVPDARRSRATGIGISPADDVQPAERPRVKRSDRDFPRGFSWRRRATARARF